MRSRLPYFRSYAADELDRLAGLPLHARGLYETLRCRQWLDGRLPAAEDALIRVARVSPAQFRAAWIYIAHLFPIVAEGVRAAPELAEQREAAEAKGQKARVAAGARWGHSEGTGTSVANSPQATETGNPLSVHTRPDANALRQQSECNAPLIKSRSRIKSRSKEQEHDQEEEGLAPPPATTGQAARPWVAEAFWPDLDRLLLAVPDPHSWAAEIRAHGEGMPGHGPARTPAQLGQAVRDFLASGATQEARPSLKHFRGFIGRTDRGTARAGVGQGAPLATPQPAAVKLRQITS